jgi:hypothetical protein
MKNTIIFLMLTLLTTTSCNSDRWTNVVPPIHLTAPSHKSRIWLKNNAPLHVKKDVAECIRGARALERIEEDSTVTRVKVDSHLATIAAAITGAGIFIWSKLVWLLSLIV